jgi:hypothetical protein
LKEGELRVNAEKDGGEMEKWVVDGGGCGRGEDGWKYSLLKYSEIAHRE